MHFWFFVDFLISNLAHTNVLLKLIKNVKYYTTVKIFCLTSLGMWWAFLFLVGLDEVNGWIKRRHLFSSLMVSPHNHGLFLTKRCSFLQQRIIGFYAIHVLIVYFSSVLKDYFVLQYAFIYDCHLCMHTSMNLSLNCCYVLELIILCSFFPQGLLLVSIKELS